MKKTLLTKLFLLCFILIASKAWSQGWTGLGTGVSGGSGYVKAVAVWNGNVYVGGNFTTAGSVSASNIAKWNGTTQTWSALGSGITGGEVKALCVYNNALYVAGSFTTAGGITTSHIAKLDASGNWSAVGSTQGTSGDVYALIAFNNLLYVGGSFLTAGGVSAHYVGTWNSTTSTWAGSGTGTSGFVYCFAAHGASPTLYAGTNGGYCLEELVGVAWGQVIASFGSASMYVQSLASFGTYLYMSGSFTFGPIKNLMRWNGSAASNVGGNTPLLINPGAIVTFANAMKVFNGSLWVGGNFTDAGAVSNTSRLAKWSGTAWSSAYVSPTTLNSDVYALDTGLTGSPSVNNIYVGGAFTAPFSRVMKGVTNVGVEEIAMTEGTVSIYPNPSHGRMNVRINRELNNPSIEIYNILGDKVYSEALKSDFETITRQFVSGIYFVKVFSGQEGSISKVFTQKIVVE
jgi:hypothetical protein